ncbi:hypothetical protein EDD29_8619 [Actinocorallia herbida]|uniref:Ig-like domain-containing protein n=1 Tax=Actinocorallia herbida TaxID=58109 RepID=A0A3N1DCM0_9ACTN|nr:hypothetical protein [Actinocorallia herbida]ROO90878.1 hypothetical protein EDD29_8619 [Actinocorallia herbida]
MRTVVAPLVLTVLLPAVAIVTPAHAAGPLKVRSAKATGSPVITADGKAKVPIRVRVTGTRITDVDATLRLPNGKGFALVSDLKRASGTAGDGIYKGTAVLDKADWGGKYTLEVGATDGTSGNAYYDFVIHRKAGAITVRRAAKLSSTSPARAVKGAKAKAKGTVKGLTLKGGFSGLKGATVQIWFRPKGGKAVRLGTAKTNAKGAYTFTFKASADGSVSARFPGGTQWQKRSTAWKALDVT